MSTDEVQIQPESTMHGKAGKDVYNSIIVSFGIVAIVVSFILSFIFSKTLFDYGAISNLLGLSIIGIVFLSGIASLMFVLLAGWWDSIAQDIYTHSTVDGRR